MAESVIVHTLVSTYSNYTTLCQHFRESSHLCNKSPCNKSSCKKSNKDLLSLRIGPCNSTQTDNESTSCDSPIEFVTRQRGLNGRFGSRTAALTAKLRHLQQHGGVDKANLLIAISVEKQSTQADST